MALRYFWDLVIRDYIDWWFSPLSPDTEFPSACRRSLETLANSFAAHVQSKIPAEMVMLAIMSASSTLIVFFRELRSASLETESASGVAEYIRNNPDSALAQMIDEKFQREKLRYLASRILASFARKKDMECDPARLFSRELLAMQIFDLTATSCSTSSYINWYIVETFKDVEKEGGLLGKDSRAKEAEEAMARALAEAAEMTRLLEAEREGREGTPLPVSEDLVPTSPPSVPESAPKTTFASILRDPEVIPHQPRFEAPLEHSSATPAINPECYKSEPTMPPSTSESSLAANLTPEGFESPARLSSTSLQYDEPPHETLQGATISLMDLSTDFGTGKPIRQKSTLSYMITIEPTGGRVPGWVAIKQFPDFESLHDVLRRIAAVGGIRSFPAELPEWKGKMHQSLADELEQYLKSALGVKQLADSEAMKRFFGKEITDQSLAKKKAWPPLKGVGDGMKGAAEGSQKLFAAAWATTTKKRSSIPPVGREKSRSELTLKEIAKDDIPTPDEDTAYHSPLFREAPSLQDSTSISRSGTSNSLGVDSVLERSSTSSSLNGYTFIGDGDTSNSASSTSLETPSAAASAVDLARPEPTSTPPPPPPIFSEPTSELQPPSAPITKPPSPVPPPVPERKTTAKPTVPELSANDAQQILDIGFSILSEFYALSPRTWLIRKSLLNLLKSLLISNGRTYIETIRTYIQEDLITKCLTSDDWIAGQVKAMTESIWPANPWPPIDDAAYKVQAKELFMTKMLPETMRGLMGGAATSQALEIVFEALQDQRVAKGILVALMCDIIRTLQV